MRRVLLESEQFARARRGRIIGGCLVALALFGLMLLGSYLVGGIQ